jgi:hypothetical protein
LFLIAIKDLNIQKSLEIDELVTHFAYELMTEKEKELEEAEMKRKVAADKKLKLELKIDKIDKYIDSKITKKEMREKKKEMEKQKKETKEQKS